MTDADGAKLASPSDPPGAGGVPAGGHGGLPLAFGLLAAFRVPEMKPAIDKINRLVRRR